jgi:hypothetical protein
MLVHIFYGHLVYFMVIDTYILWPFGLFYGHVVYYSPFWYVVPRKIWQALPGGRGEDSVCFLCRNHHHLHLVPIVLIPTRTKTQKMHCLKKSLVPIVLHTHRHLGSKSLVPIVFTYTQAPGVDLPRKSCKDLKKKLFFAEI